MTAAVDALTRFADRRKLRAIYDAVIRSASRCGEVVIQTSAKDVDAEVARWLQQAFEQNC